MTPEPGLRGEARLDVTDADTALAFGSGDVPVLATPRLVALLEAAAVAALQGSLAAGETTVGTRVDVRHLAATPVGGSVRAEAVLTSVDGATLTFDVRARDERAEIAHGTHARALVDRERFLRRSANAG